MASTRHHLRTIRRSYRVLVAGTASSVAEALTLAQRLSPDLAMFDIRLPGDEDGIVGAGLLRRSSDLPILFLTGEIEPGVRKRAAAFQSAALLIKPVHAQMLIEAVERILQQGNLELKRPA